MATRCLINFSSKNNEFVDLEDITIYKHWDGYPSNVLEILKRFLEVNTREQIDYKSAGFLRYIQIIEMDSVFDKEPFLSYGIVGNHDFKDNLGADYVYKVCPKLIYIYSCNYSNSDLELISTVEVEKLKDDYRYLYDILEEIKGK